MEIRPDHRWEIGQGAPPGRGARGGTEPGWASHDPHHRVLGGLDGPHAPPPTPPPLDPRGEAPRREAGGEAEDGDGAVTSARGGGRSRRRSRGRCVEAPGELLQCEGITDLQEGGCQLLVRKQRPHDLVAAGKAPQNVEDQDGTGYPRSRTALAVRFIFQQNSATDRSPCSRVHSSASSWRASVCALPRDWLLRASQASRAVPSGVRTMSCRSREMVPKIQDMAILSWRRHARSRASTGVSERTWSSRAYG
jgi:hypothetical protein